MGRTVQARQSLSASGITRAAAAPFKAIWNGMIWLGEANQTMKALTRLSETSDERLSEKGLTRDGEIRRVIGDRYV